MFERERESLARQGKWAWFLLVPLICIGSYCVCGIGVAIAIPALEYFGASANAMRYGYSIDSCAGDRARIVAEGDLDEDGIRSRHVIECRVVDGACACDDRRTIADELE